jgi:hypothetical protein
VTRLAGLLAPLAVVTAVVWATSVVHLGVWRNLHHFWYGAALYALGLAFGVDWLLVVGLLVAADDAVQHAVQCSRPEYRSPLHLLARYTVYRWGWIK